MQILKNVLQKSVGGVGFLMKAYSSLPQCCQFLGHGCRNRDIDLKFKMGGRIDIILMCVKFGDDPISSLDFSFIGEGGTKLLILWRS